MTKSTPDIPILDDDAVAKIEALSAKVPEGPWFVDKDDAEDVPDHRRSGLALVDTGRSADWWIARLCEWHTARFIAESKTNVDALCQTVRALRAENERAINVLVTAHNDTVVALQLQLEQVTKERDRFSELADKRHDDLCEARRQRDRLAADHAAHTRDVMIFVRSACVEKVKALLAAIKQRNPDGPKAPDAYRVESLEQVIEELESVSIQEQEKQ